MTDKGNAKDEAKKALPDFITSGTRLDKILFAAFVVINFYFLALIPFRAKLLIDAPLLNVFLTGGNFSTLALAAKNPENIGFLIFVVFVAALSAIKFLPIYFLIGKRIGAKFLNEYLFRAHKPLWFRKLESFIYRHPGLALGCAFIPFSPISATLVTLVAGISQVRGKVFALFAFVFALLLKIFYMVIGIIFGAEVITVLQVIDKYMLWITFALVAYLMFVTLRKERMIAKTDSSKKDE